MTENSKVFLWIQRTPDTFQKVLSCNGEQIQPNTSRYNNIFDLITSQDITDYKDLTSTLRKITKKKYKINSENCCIDNGKHRMTFFSGNYEETDKTNRKICYYALIVDAKDSEEECDLLVKESKLYGCSISDGDVIALKKKRIDNKQIVVLFLILATIFLISTIIFLILWIQNTQKISLFFNTMN